MKTQDEIVARIKKMEPNTFLGFELEALLGSLDFEHAAPWLKAETKAEEWVKDLALDDAAVKAKALDYLEFAWGKAEDHRGISASRSVAKLTEYCWLLGMDELVGRIEREEISYAQYGAPVLKAISEALGYPVPTDPALVRMMQGASCTPDCESGCGS